MPEEVRSRLQAAVIASKGQSTIGVGRSKVSSRLHASEAVSEHISQLEGELRSLRNKRKETEEQVQQLLARRDALLAALGPSFAIELRHEVFCDAEKSKQDSFSSRLARLQSAASKKEEEEATKHLEEWLNGIAPSS